MKTLRIKGLKSDYIQDCPVDNELVPRLVEYTVDLHNRDNPDDPWIAGELPEKIEKKETK